MRIIFIRHEKSINNELAEKSYELYLKERSNDPDISSQGQEKCELIGKFLKENNIKINKFYSSLHLRALKTMKFIANAYDPDKLINRECFYEIHEKGGIYYEEKGFPGMNKEKILNLFPEFILKDEYDIKDGWYKSDKKETNEEFKQRVKKVINILKEMAIKENEDYTICCITHALFLNGFFSLLNGSDFYNENLSFNSENLNMSSITINKDKKINIDFINFSIFK
jgi:broad specificity phosphatase PhoE